MLSLLLGFAEARKKHYFSGGGGQGFGGGGGGAFIKAVNGVQYHEIDPLMSYIPKNPRYVKSFRPIQSTEAVENGGVTKVNVGVRRVWVYLNDQDAKNFAAGCSIGAIIAGFIPEALASKIVAACCGISGILVNAYNHGNGVILKIPHPLGQALLGTPAISSQ